MANKKKIVQQIEKDSQALAKKQKELIVLEHELSSNPTFVKFLALKKAVDTQDVLFRETVKNEMIRIKEEFGEKTIEGDFGRITLVEPKPSVKVVDEDLVPDEFKKLVVDTKAISDDYELTDVLPAGVELKESTSYIKITPKKEKN